MECLQPASRPRAFASSAETRSWPPVDLERSEDDEWCTTILVGMNTPKMSPEEVKEREDKGISGLIIPLYFN